MHALMVRVGETLTTTGSAPVRRPLVVKCIESDRHSAICTIYILSIVNTMVKLKQFYPYIRS